MKRVYMEFPNSARLGPLYAVLALIARTCGGKLIRERVDLPAGSEAYRIEVQYQREGRAA